MQIPVLFCIVWACAACGAAVPTPGQKSNVQEKLYGVYRTACQRLLEKHPSPEEFLDPHLQAKWLAVERIAKSPFDSFVDGTNAALEAQLAFNNYMDSSRLARQNQPQPPMKPKKNLEKQILEILRKHGILGNEAKNLVDQLAKDPEQLRRLRQLLSAIDDDDDDCSIWDIILDSLI